MSTHLAGLYNLRLQLAPSVAGKELYDPTRNPNRREHPCLGEDGKKGPVQKKRFIQAHNVYVEWQDVYLEVSAHDFGNTGSRFCSL